MPDNVASLSSNFTAVDWLVLIGYLVFVSVLGVRLAGKQSSMEDFFRGGNRLPWYAVSGSMIATIISAVTFVGVPAVAYAQTGISLTLQFGIVAGLLSRLFVAYFLVPAYYRHEVYSPYDYMGQRLGESARSVTTALFSVLGVLAQAARVYLTAIILQLVLEQQFDAVSAVTGVSPLVLAISAGGHHRRHLDDAGRNCHGGLDRRDVVSCLRGRWPRGAGRVASQMPDGLGQVFREGWAAGKVQTCGTVGDARSSGKVQLAVGSGAHQTVHHLGSHLCRHVWQHRFLWHRSATGPTHLYLSQPARRETGRASPAGWRSLWSP